MFSKSVYLIMVLFLFGLQYFLRKIILEKYDEKGLDGVVLNGFAKIIFNVIIPVLITFLMILVFLDFPMSILIFAILLPLPHTCDAILQWKYNKETRRHLVSMYMVVAELCFSVAFITYYLWNNL